jgi:peptide/nickel transport system substrate-binding protein
VLSKVTEPIVLYTAGAEEQAAEAIAEQLRGYGMNVTAQVIDSAAATQMANDGTFELFLTSAGYGTGDFIGTYYSNNFECKRLQSNQVRTGFCNEGLDELANSVRLETDPVKKKELLEEVTKKLSSEFVPWVPLFGQTEVWALQPYVKGFVGSSAGQWYDLQNVSVEK